MRLCRIQSFLFKGGTQSTAAGDRAGKPVNLMRVLAGFVPAGTDPAHPGL
jgi:hypothetical protein